MAAHHLLPGRQTIGTLSFESHNFVTRHTSRHGSRSECSLSNNCLSASFPALLAAVIVGKNVADCSTALALPAR
jgi:hypothetical protein